MLETLNGADSGNAWPGKMILGANNWTNAGTLDLNGQTLSSVSGGNFTNTGLLTGAGKLDLLGGTLFNNAGGLVSPGGAATVATLSVAACAHSERISVGFDNQSTGQEKSRRFAVHRGLIASGDRFVSSAREVQALCAALPEVLCVEMEGAAVAQVCHDYGIPFAALRTISDRADESAHMDFPVFVRDVAGPYALGILSLWLQAHASQEPLNG